MSNGVKALLVMTTPVVVISGGIWILGVEVFLNVVAVMVVVGFLVWIWSMIKGVFDDHDRHQESLKIPASPLAECREPWPQPSLLSYDLVEGLDQETQTIAKVNHDRP